MKASKEMVVWTCRSPNRIWESLAAPMRSAARCADTVSRLTDASGRGPPLGSQYRLSSSPKVPRPATKSAAARAATITASPIRA